MRRFIGITAVLLVAACSHTTVVEPDDPTHTTLHPTTPTSPTTPTPTVPNVVGVWSGIATVVSSFIGNDFNSCNVTLTIAAQASGQFFGLISFAGGTVTRCSQSGNAFGSIGSSGAVSLEFSLNGDVTSCAAISDQAPLTGIASNDTVTLSQTLHRSCSPSTSQFSQDGVQSLSVSLRR